MAGQDGSSAARHRRTASEESGVLGTALTVSSYFLMPETFLIPTDKAY